MHAQRTTRPGSIQSGSVTVPGPTATTLPRPHVSRGWKNRFTCLRVHCLHGACTWERRIPGLRRADAERVVLHQVGTDGRNSRLESVGPGHKGSEAQADGLLGGGDQRALIPNGLELNMRVFVQLCET